MNKKERPILINLVNEGTSDIEKFQNEVIRPIIKMQHNLLITLFKNYLFKKKIDFSNIKDDVKKETVNTVLTKDITFKNILLGIIIGHFSTDELDFYSLNSSELNRRILQIIKQRLEDSIFQL